MIPLYSLEEFEKATANSELKCRCKTCENTFTTKKKYITYSQKHPNSNRYTNSFCSRECRDKSFVTQVSVQCLNCEKSFTKAANQVKKYPNHFCSRSCSATYNNKNKKYGTKRSKLETWIEGQLTSMFPSLEIHFNKSEAISSELDIYIPSLNVAFELNGIFHYEPIYGVDKLERIQENDQSKTKACHEAKIDLCVIDTSAQKYVKPKTSQKYLDIIVKIINDRLSIS